MKIPANTLLNVAVGAGVHALPIFLMKNPPYPNPHAQNPHAEFYYLLFAHFVYMAGRAIQGIPLTKFLLEYGGFLFGFIYGGRLLNYIKQP